MKVRRFVVAELAITEFDDGLVWLNVNKRQSAHHAQTLYQTRAASQLSDEELDYALMVLDDLAQMLVNRQRRRQQQLF